MSALLSLDMPVRHDSRETCVRAETCDDGGGLISGFDMCITRPPLRTEAHRSATDSGCREQLNIDAQQKPE